MKFILVFLLISVSLFGQKNQIFKFNKNVANVIVKKPSPINTKFVWLLGQSNCVGVSPIASLPSYISGVIPNSYILNIGNSQIEQLTGGVNNRGAFDFPLTNTTFGVELSLMKYLDSINSTPNYLVKIGQQATALAINSSLYNWNWYSNFIGSNTFRSMWYNSWDYYNRMMMQMPVDQKVNWLVWIQGEEDTTNSTYYNNYQTNLIDLINNLRSITGQGTNLKVVLVSLSSGQTSLNSTGRSAVNTAMSNTSTSLTNVFYYSQNNSTTDGIHYTTQGYINISKGVANIIVNN